ncbi:MAG: hypothetical protein A2270_10100 [Elusimicrobia bacterium RIFOXYA12_FULL_51_18]|nr:MAG: hypothetical protein A2270_10100 [Elusimicrobia bacterium RIFOXYA12_FULL_51_18]OGS30772.1 MAG: hypothetical protein A2218_08265 [Elusimicrobia bacterium RIFOXYA2_FULL_53_38]
MALAIEPRDAQSGRRRISCALRVRVLRGKKTGGLRRLAELGQKAMLLASNILAVPEGYSPAPGLKTLRMERAENPPPPLRKSYALDVPLAIASALPELKIIFIPPIISVHPYRIIKKIGFSRNNTFFCQI